MSVARRSGSAAVAVIAGAFVAWEHAVGRPRNVVCEAAEKGTDRCSGTGGDARASSSRPSPPRTQSMRKRTANFQQAACGLPSRGAAGPGWLEWTQQLWPWPTWLWPWPLDDADRGRGDKQDPDSSPACLASGPGHADNSVETNISGGHSSAVAGIDLDTRFDGVWRLVSRHSGAYNVVIALKLCQLRTRAHAAQAVLHPKPCV